MNTSLPIHSNRIIFVATDKYHNVFKRLSTSDDYYQFAFSQEVSETSDALQYDIYTKSKVILGSLKCYYPVGGSDLWIQTLIVRKEFARHGYGSLILQRFILTFIRQYSIHKIFLTCHKNNVAGIHFWEQHGFIRQDTPIKNDYHLFAADIRSLTCIKEFLTH